MKENKVVMCICIISLFICAFIALDCGAVLQQTQNSATENTLLIDPGHGGMDGGAVSSDGTSEKDINLKIALELKRQAEASGWIVIMTREADEWLCTTEKGSIRSCKTEDLRARCEMIRKYRPQVAVSIHLNSFKEDPSVRGIQVFYSETADSDGIRFAEVMQNSLNKTLAVVKERSAMVRKDVMLFRDPECPIVIVECGFLSNKEEAELLQEEEYQQQIAAGIITGITEFTGRKMPINIEIIDSLR